MKNAYTFVVSHEDGRTIEGFCEAASATLAEGYAQYVAMKQRWAQEDITVRVEAWPGCKSREETRRDAMRCYAEYDRSIGHDTDDEGNSYHDYS